MITFERLMVSSETMLADINALLPQLRSNPGEPLGTIMDLEAITGDRNTFLIVAKDGEKIIGMATLYAATKFGKKTGFVEDVVMDSAYRGRGLGKKTMETLIEEAKKDGISQLYLTSRPERGAAHGLYEKLGFKKKETTVFKLVF
jgi:ribosomal protein S18 acetylase RimI-like enzyme